MSEDRKKGLFYNILQKIKSNKKLQYAIVIIFIVITLSIALFGFNNESSSTSENSSSSNCDTISEYVSNLETRLSNTLSKVNGAGKVSVIITVESGMETVLAMKTTTKETSTGIETEQTPIIINGKTVVIKEAYPNIVGVLIVAEGANNISVMTKLQQATVSLLNIKLDQIEILAMK